MKTWLLPAVVEGLEFNIKNSVWNVIIKTKYLAMMKVIGVNV